MCRTHVVIAGIALLTHMACTTGPTEPTASASPAEQDVRKPSPAAEDKSAQELDGETETNARMRLLRESGQSAGDPWTTQAETLFARYKAQAPTSVLGSILSERTECFRLGCVTHMGLATAAAADGLTLDFYQSAAHEQFPGSVFRSPIVLSPKGGPVTAIWIAGRDR